MRTKLPLGIALTLLNTSIQAQSEISTPAVEEIIVTSRASALYRVLELSSGKMPTEPLTSTQTIQVINEQLIADLGARDAQDLYRNLSGVSLFSYAGVTARGFRQEENFYDGLRGDPYVGFSVPQLFNIERLEFLKGPSGMLYGAGAPGGLFNYITKVANSEPSIEASAVLGNNSRKGVSVEANGELTSQLSGRIAVFDESRDLPRDNADSDINIYDGGLNFEYDKGRVILQATEYKQYLGGNRLRGVPVDDSGKFLTDTSWNHNEAADFLRMKSEVLQARVEHSFAHNLNFDAGLRWNESDETQQYHEPRGLFDSDNDGIIDSSVRQFRDQYRDNESLSFGANLVWEKSFNNIDNRLLSGMDWYESEGSFIGYSLSGSTTAQPGLPTPLSLFTPEYGSSDPAQYDLPPIADYSKTLTTQKRSGYYLLNEATLGKWIGVVGVRQDQFEDRDSINGTSFDDSATTWRAGLVYRLNPDVSFFAQWAQSFTPQGIASQDPMVGGPFEPEQGTIIEAGVRTELYGGRVQTSAAVYQAIRSNVLQTHPLGDINGDGRDDLAPLGEVTSEGIELDATIDITPNWVAIVTYAYNDTRITRTSPSSTLTNSVGDRFANAPEHQAGLWTRYQVPSINTAFAIGADYVGERISISGQTVRAYTVLDASIIYEKNDWRMLLRASNLLDKTYAASGFIDRTGHFPGTPRAVFAEVTKRW